MILAGKSSLKVYMMPHPINSYSLLQMPDLLTVMNILVTVQDLLLHHLQIESTSQPHKHFT